MGPKCKEGSFTSSSASSIVLRPVHYLGLDDFFFFRLKKQQHLRGQIIWSRFSNASARDLQTNN